MRRLSLRAVEGVLCVSSKQKASVTMSVSVLMRLFSLKYKYSHDEADGVSSQDYLGVDRTYYQPVDRGFESELRTRLAAFREKLNQAKN